jgi:hypothetical protein
LNNVIGYQHIFIVEIIHFVLIPRAGMWKSQEYGKLFELPTLLWIPLRGLHFPTFSFLTQDYLKSKVRKIVYVIVLT